MSLRLSVSNLAFPAELRADAYGRLKSLGVQGVEIAPTRLAAWDGLTPAVGAAEAAILADAGLQASSLQAIYFGRPELQLLGDEASFEALLDHTRRMAEFGAALGARVAVFGAPKNRSRGQATPEEALALGEARFRRLGEATAPFGVTLGLEPVPAHYGGDFLTTAQEVTAMVRQVDHPQVRLHLDTGCVMLGGGDIAASVAEGADVLAHFHAAEPDLGDFRTPSSPHAAAARALRSVGYAGWVAIEMREAAGDPLAEIERAVRFVLDAYGEPG